MAEPVTKKPSRGSDSLSSRCGSRVSSKQKPQEEPAKPPEEPPVDTGAVEKAAELQSRVDVLTQQETAAQRLCEEVEQALHGFEGDDRGAERALHLLGEAVARDLNEAGAMGIVVGKLRTLLVEVIEKNRARVTRERDRESTERESAVRAEREKGAAELKRAREEIKAAIAGLQAENEKLKKQKEQVYQMIEFGLGVSFRRLLTVDRAHTILALVSIFL